MDVANRGQEGVINEQMSLFVEAQRTSPPKNAGIVGGALLSPDGVFRYTLTRAWGGPEPRTAVFVMLNPSTADAAADDPTIRRCIGFAKRLGCGALTVVNLYALRATNPAALASAADPVGPGNSDFIRTVAGDAIARGGILIAAWGASGPKGWKDRAARVLEVLSTVGDVYCLGKTFTSAPRHPLYVKADAPLELLAKG